MSNNLKRVTQVGPNGITTQCVNNDLGRHTFIQTKDKNGHQTTQSDLFEETLCGTDSRRAVKGDNVSSTGGNVSNFVSEKSESVVGSQYLVCGSPWMLRMHPGEDVDREMTEWVAMKSQPETVPDTGLLSLAKGVLEPAPNLTQCIVMPPAQELEDGVPKTPTMVVAQEFVNFCARVQAIISACTLETAKEMIKIQTKHSKNVIKNNIEEKKKMFNKMPTASKEAFKENMGKALCPTDENGEFSFEKVFESAGNAVQMLSNPMSLISMCFSPSTDPETTPQKQRYDKDSAQDMAVKKQRQVTDAERRMS